ncbi:hypothetical protein L833_5057 [Mycobacteroides abscessus MAB_091912_2446]|uniref:Uncharacterized protein n=1 Tax=Mycobacteroides abscessus MAB_091912_2446 TaxID=1335414 RepID=A0A829M3X8_9MYCO|nr:hypothetical protein L833_5057 [Mycobacteroides abscessus MAB_091912_2446]
MTTFLADLSQRDMQRRLSEALRVYVIAMGYRTAPRISAPPCGWSTAAGLAGRRLPSSILQPPRPVSPDRRGPDGAGRIVGIAYGYRGAADQWWHQQVSQGLRKTGLPRDRINALLNQYFELTELHVDPVCRGTGTVRLWRDGCSRAAQSHMSCCPLPRSAGNPTAPGGCTAGSGSLMSSGSTSSQEIPGDSRC